MYVTGTPLAVVPVDSVPQDAPAIVQFRVAAELMSFTINAESESEEPLAAVFGVLLCPFPNTIAIALRLNAMLAALLVFAADVAVGVAMQSAFNDEAAGGV